MPLSPWTATAPVNRQSTRYPKGVLLALIRSALKEIWYEAPCGKAILIERIPGDILCFRVFGRVIVVLNSIKASKDLLERRGDIYSDRPVIPMYEMYVFFLSFGILAWR